MSNLRNNPTAQRTSRELSGRLEQDFHRRDDPFRQQIWRLSIAAATIVVVGIIVAAATGRRTVYEAGPVAAAHRFFENDCLACHTTWAPASRLVSWSGAKPIHSVDDAQCQLCHAGLPHYEGQDPPHAGLGCATCHREHRGEKTLIAMSHERCVDCHQAPEEQLAGRIVNAGDALTEPTLTPISSFASNHPEFDALADADETQLAFNHRVHLRHEYDVRGKLVKGIQNERGELEDLSQNCAACHEADNERRYMEPIDYSRHCSRCHPLYYDNLNFPGDVVPHGVITAALRGFLIEQYTRLALRDETLVEPPAAPRPLPGRRISTGLSEEVRREVHEAASAADERLVAPVVQAEEAARDAALRREQGLGPNGAGGCRLCHAVDDGDTFRDQRGFVGEWHVAPTNIPHRWMGRSQFSHDSHRFVACTACHAAVDSAATADVLMPSIDACRSCHGTRAEVQLSDGTNVTGPGVGSRCIDCHAYHRREGEPMDGGAVLSLQGHTRTRKDSP